MWRYVLLMVRRQPGKSALAGSGFLLAACALILLSATTQTTVVQANQIISQSWRSSYDLVVLPPHAHIPSKETIPADLLEGYDGGISLQQYQQIKSLPGVEVAAPIAYVGYVQMPTPKVLFSKEALAPGYYRLDWTLAAFNGLHTVIERNETTYFYHLNGCNANEILSQQSMIDALDKEHVIFDCNDASVPWSEFSTVDSGTFLLAGIDPSAQNQLVHLDKSMKSGRMRTSEDKVHLDTDPNLGITTFCLDEHAPNSCQKRYTVPDSDIPVLLHQQLPGQITLKGTFARVGPATLDPKFVIARGGSTYLAGLPPLQILFDGAVPLIQNDPQRFSTRESAWNGHSWEPFVPFFGKNPFYYHLNFLYTPSELTYQVKDAPDGSTASVVQPKGVQEPEAAFRVLQPLHLAQGPKPYIPKEYYFFDPVGSFSGTSLTAQFSNP